MRIEDIPAYVLQHYALKISRRTAFNWVNKGIGGLVLKATPKAGPAHYNPRVVKAADVDDFVSRTGVAGR